MRAKEVIKTFETLIDKDINQIVNDIEKGNYNYKNYEKTFGVMEDIGKFLRKSKLYYIRNMGHGVIRLRSRLMKLDNSPSANDIYRIQRDLDKIMGYREQISV